MLPTLGSSLAPKTPLSLFSRSLAPSSSSSSYLLSTSFRGRSLESFGFSSLHQSNVNFRAKEVTKRIETKLSGTDFEFFGETKTDFRSVDVATQCSKLIQQATDAYNVGQAYIGWCPFW